MLEWLKRRWQALEGNVDFALITALSAYIGTLLSVSAVKRWLHLSVTNFGMLIWCLIPAIVVLSTLLVRTKHRTKLELSSTGGPAPTISILVKNLRKPATISAFAEIMGHPNNNNQFPSGEFRLGWGDGTEAVKLIGTGAMESLLVASFRDVLPHDLYEMVLLQNLGKASVPKASFRWNDAPNETVPSFNCHLRFTSDAGFEKKVIFSVGPIAPRGPLRVIFMEAGDTFNLLQKPKVRL